MRCVEFTPVFKTTRFTSPYCENQQVTRPIQKDTGPPKARIGGAPTQLGRVISQTALS